MSQVLGSSKAPDAFRTISEVAEDLDVPQHVLRFWETRFTSIRPLKRGGGRRYYRPDDVELLRGIRQLLYGQGFTIKGVQRILKEDGPRVVQDVGRGGTLPLRRAEIETAEDDFHGETGSEQAASWESAASAAQSHPSHPPPVSLPIAGTDLGRLRDALDDLLECQRTLGALRRR